MASANAPLKQTLHNTPALVALGGALHLLPHYTKPFRRRHILLLLMSLLLVLAMVLELTVVITRQSLDPRTLFSSAATPGVVKQLNVIRSSNGFALSYDEDLFSAMAVGPSSATEFSPTELKKGVALSAVKLAPLPSRVPAPEAAAEFDVKVETDAAAFATYKANFPTKTDITGITAAYFAPKPSNIATITEEARTTEAVGGTLMTKSIYLITPKFAGKPSHTIVWSGEIKGKALAVTIRGIVVGSGVPTSMKPVMDSVKLDSDKKVEGVSDIFDAAAPVVDQKYVADLVSPAVVKVYHIVCGSLVYQGNVMSDDVCSGVEGSGFIVSEDGYIATNGHVVVYGAKDMLVNALLQDPQLLEQFLVRSSFSSVQIKEIVNRPDLTASVVSQIYDLSNDDLRLINQRERTIVATGSTPVDLSNEEAVKKVVKEFENTSSLKQATVIASDYEAKDQLTLVAEPDKGFSASDVALIKIDTDNAPIIKLSTDAVRLNQKISLFGFPGDADNELTDNSKISVSVTNGSVNSIRDAAGGETKLYQSDADASHGSSGGPAVDENGRAFGLLTYRFESGESGDAAKSYIRDIKDFTDLVSSKNIVLRTDSSTQGAWEKGLDYYGKQQYAAALKEFQKVGSDYPAHRLASTYAELSRQAISDGKNVSEPNMILLVSGIATGMALLGVSIVLIARHFGHHRVYKTYHRHGLSLRSH